jgi:hypothetical protein
VGAEWVLNFSLLMNRTAPDSLIPASTYELGAKIFLPDICIEFFKGNFLDAAE